MDIYNKSDWTAFIIPGLWLVLAYHGTLDTQIKQVCHLDSTFLICEM